VLVVPLDHSGPEAHEPIDLGVDVIGGEVDVPAVLHRLGLGHQLEEEPRPEPGGRFDQDRRVVLGVVDPQPLEGVRAPRLDGGMTRRVGHPRLTTALREVEESIDAAWLGFCRESGVEVGSDEGRELARVVLQDPSEFGWRVVDGAMKQLTCDECGSGLGSGPSGCRACEQANGFRFAAREFDRPGVPPGNEHAIRVASAVARTRDRYTPRARCGYELALPDLLAGTLPTTAQAQALKAAINQLSDEELETVLTVDDVTAAVGR
jgi:hypothetical protein